MREQDNGGNAFPYSALTPDGPEIYGDCKGMTLRDYFAGQAIASVLSASADWSIGNERDAARVAYVIADALLKERAKC